MSERLKIKAIMGYWRCTMGERHQDKIILDFMHLCGMLHNKR